jgi:hypothetical protein
MANYKETTIAGSSYIRAKNVHFTNGETEKNVIFVEEQIINLDGETIRKDAGEVYSEFTPDNAASDFSILNPETGEDSGQSMTFQDVYVALYSLYLHLANERDIAAAQAEADAIAAAEAAAEAAAQAQAEAEAIEQAEAEAAAAADATPDFDPETTE